MPTWRGNKGGEHGREGGADAAPQVELGAGDRGGPPPHRWCVLAALWGAAVTVEGQHPPEAQVCVCPPPPRSAAPPTGLAGSLSLCPGVPFCSTHLVLR